ncbi:MAG: MgtC/SapB family protein [Pseudomonadales bacterium]|uniref:MgtC family transporter n=1 Tax=Oleiphilus messinensis TaxID=141451 RepID=A0A1Y0I6L7_9GAMM|nr:MgtC/SapB family protein [Oleiphilus messinensis]ARU55426.1 MgtC family transporter [Oleiphilus messinensis]MCG8609822.1 MgtC/SapB family protein [Pseudomonadales bacterium]
MDLQTNDLIGLSIALALGLLIGIQRGWTLRNKAAGERVAGVRTYTLVGLLGGVCAMLSRSYGQWIVIATLLGLAAVICTAYYRSKSQSNDLSITSLIGTLLTFLFGVLAVEGYWTTAACTAVITALILDNKQEIHGLLTKLQDNELDAALKLLLISVVMLSLLPNEGFGPWQAFNPYEIWWMVVLIASISFIGYFAVRIGGASRGILFTSLFAGLSSSTALTLHYAKMAKDNPNHSNLLASGILAACGTMFPRLLIVCTLINNELGNALLIPGIAMMILTYIPALYMWINFKAPLNDAVELKQNPLEMLAALGFAIVLLVIILLSHLLNETFGDTGIYILAMISGITDVDAINLTLSRQAGNSITLETATIAILIAAAVNSVVKAFMAGLFSGRNLFKPVTLPLTIAVAGGLSVALLLS